MRGTMEIGIQHQSFAGGGQGAVAYVSPDLVDVTSKCFDAGATIAKLRAAIEAIEAGHGADATRAAGEAFARLALYHR